MELELIRHWLVMKFNDLKNRTQFVLDQLNDEQVNWRPEGESNSIANLIFHMGENIKERIGMGIHGVNYTRDRDKEFADLRLSRTEAKKLMTDRFDELIHTAETLPEAAWFQTQLVRHQERANLDILLQSAAHFSEHVGQILYIAKMCLGEQYQSASIPKKK